MIAKTRLPALADDLVNVLRPRAKSLIVTVYGDAIGPHGGTVWLGNLIGLMELMGLSERMVRTAVFRLIKDDWLKATPIGRRSTYGLTETGWRRFEAAYRRIYAPLDIAWDGDWHLALIQSSGLSAERRDNLKRELVWQGFGSVGANVLAHPNADGVELAATLDGLGLAEQVVVMKARHIRPRGQGGSLKELVREGWDLEGLSQGYAGFLARFRPALDALQAGEAPDPATAFKLRILMMHDFRRVLLRDPLLPVELLPEGWTGTKARQLCKDVYVRLHKGSEEQLMGGLETAEGPLPPLHHSYFTRFGGLKI